MNGNYVFVQKLPWESTFACRFFALSFIAHSFRILLVLLNFYIIIIKRLTFVMGRFRA